MLYSYEEVEQSDTSYKIKQVRPDGSFRFVSNNHHDYIKCKELGYEIKVIKYTAPVIEEPDPKQLAIHDLSHTDSKMIRAIDDIINVLMAKGVITKEDLPSEVVAKLEARSNLRTQINKE